MKNIVTIDFDIIMAPCIELYNNLASAYDWEYFSQFDQMRVLTADMHHYQKLTKWLIKIINNIDKTNIFFVENHAQIIQYLNKKEKINIYNIDHHHDCGYQLDENKTNLQLHCGNWGLVLKNMNILNDFIWIKNENSNSAPLNKRQVNYKEYNLINFNLDNLPIPDKLIICLSEQWIPPNFRPLYFIWLDILNNYYNTNFTVDYTRY